MKIPRNSKGGGKTPVERKSPNGDAPAWMQLAAAFAVFAWAVCPTLLRILIIGIAMGLLIKVYREKATARPFVKPLLQGAADRYQVFLERRLKEACKLRQNLETAVT